MPRERKVPRCNAMPLPIEIHTNCKYCGMPFTYPQSIPYCSPPSTNHAPLNSNIPRMKLHTECRDKHTEYLLKNGYIIRYVGKNRERLEPRFIGSAINKCTCISFEDAYRAHRGQVITWVQGSYVDGNPRTDIIFKDLKSIYRDKVVYRWYRNDWNSKFESKVKEGIYINYFDWLIQNMRSIVSNEVKRTNIHNKDKNS